MRTLRSALDWRGQAITMLDRCYLTQGMPTLVVWGARDAVIPTHHAHIAHAAMPNSRLEAFPQTGHFPHESDHEQFLEVLETFLRTTQPVSYSSAEEARRPAAGAAGSETRRARTLIRAPRPS